MTSHAPQPNCDATLATVLTPGGRGAVAVVVVEGPDAVHVVDRFFRSAAGKPLAHFAENSVIFGRWAPGHGGGEEVVVCRRSKTCVEVNCHGGRVAYESLMRSLEAEGVLRSDMLSWYARNSSFPRVLEMLSAARTDRAASIILDQMRGALARVATSMVEHLDRGQFDELELRLKRLLELGPVGQHLTRPWRVVVTGPPNVGKSSLVNAILGYQRCLVFERPGTTRDYVSSHTAIDGWLVELIDTAGIRDSEDRIEAAGISRARMQVASADLVVGVLDATTPRHQSDLPGGSLTVANKVDLLAPRNRSRDASMFRDACMTSAVTGAGIGDLLDRIVRYLIPDPPSSREAVPLTAEHVAALANALSRVSCGDLEAARAALHHFRRQCPPASESPPASEAPPASGLKRR